MVANVMAAQGNCGIIKGGVWRLTREDKEKFIAIFNKSLADSKTVIATNFSGMTVESMSGLRGRLREAGVEYHVVKNTLMKLAAKGTHTEEMINLLYGPNALAISFNDPVSPAKILSEYLKEDSKLEIKMGILEGNLLDSQAVFALAKLPDRETLLGNLLGVLVAVPTNFVGLLAALPRNMVNVLSAIRDKKEQNNN